MGSIPNAILQEGLFDVVGFHKHGVAVVCDMLWVLLCHRGAIQVFELGQHGFEEGGRVFCKRYNFGVLCKIRC